MIDRLTSQTVLYSIPISVPFCLRNGKGSTEIMYGENTNTIAFCTMHYTMYVHCTLNILK